MQDLLLNVDNKEVLSEILHHAIDYLIRIRDDTNTLIYSSKYGFQSPDDFLVLIKKLARFYRGLATSNDDATSALLLEEFNNTLSPELLRSILAARLPEVLTFLQREQDCQHHCLVQSYDCDARIILGDSNFGHTRAVATVTLNCLEANGRTEQRHIQMTPSWLDTFIASLEQCLEDSTEKVNTC